jgi:hypothetical protein
MAYAETLRCNGHADMSTTLMYKHSVIDVEEEKRETEKLGQYFNFDLNASPNDPAPNGAIIITLKKAN